MTRKRIYALNIPRGAQTDAQSEKQRNVSTSGVVDGGSPAVESVSVGAGDQIVKGEFKGTLSDVMNREVEELFGCDGIEFAPVFAIDDNGDIVSDGINGYYSLKDITAAPVDSRSDVKGQYKFDGVLVDKGTRKGFWRAVTTDPKRVENEFGNEATSYIGVPHVATKVRWYDSASNEREAVSVVDTRLTEFGLVDIVDTEDSSLTAPTLIYEIAYEDEGRADPGVWDTRGVDKVRTLPDGDVCQWARVFDTSHEYEGAPVLDNGLTRLTFSEQRGRITASRWEGENSGYGHDYGIDYGAETSRSWESTSLGTSTWRLFDVDIFYIGDEKVRGQVEFSDQDSGDFYALNFTFRRGYLNPQWIVPKNEDLGVPQGLLDRLSPIANESVLSPDETKTLADRKEVRR